MTLDQAIERAQTIADQNKERMEEASERLTTVEIELYEASKQCYEDHAQLARWLRDYKQKLKDLLCYGCIYEKHDSYYPTCAICRRNCKDYYEEADGHARTTF